MGSKDNQEDDESALFRQAMRDVEPMRSPGKVAPWRKRKAPRPLFHEQEPDPKEAFADTQEETPDFLEFRRPGIQRRLFADLQRGVIEAEATLDLHGMRVEDARRALSRFLQYSLQRQRRCVRIIHGKGRGSRQQPVLKQRINQWLPQSQEVLAFCSAPRWDGGTGAAYVLLSRKWAQEND